MKPCVLHWNELAHAVIDRGLASFVCPIEQVDRRIAAMAGGVKDRASFCPILGAVGLLTAHVLDVLSPVISTQLMVNGDCPLCYLRDHCEKCRHDSARWIGLAADEQLRVARRIGVMAVA